MNIFMYLNVKSLLIELLIISAICSAILVIISKNPVISVIFLISLVLNSALFLMVKGMHFLGISYILIYLGAIIVLFLFVIMMINIKLTDILETGYQYTKNIPLALTVSGLFLYEFFNVLPSFLNSPALGTEASWPIDNSTILSLIKEIVLTLNSLFNNGSALEGTPSFAGHNPAEGWFILNQAQEANNNLGGSSVAAGGVRSGGISHIDNIRASSSPSAIGIFNTEVGDQLPTIGEGGQTVVTETLNTVAPSAWGSETTPNLEQLAQGKVISGITALATQTNQNWPETLISSSRSAQQIVSVAYSLYTYGAFLFLFLGIILLLAMIAPIYLSRR